MGNADGNSSSFFQRNMASFDKCELMLCRIFMRENNLNMAKQSTTNETIECANPNTGRRIQIAASTWNLFSRAIKETLKGKKELTFTEIVDGIHQYLKKNKISFKQSVEWYAITVKHDLHVRGVIEVYEEKGKKLHKLA